MYLRRKIIKCPFCKKFLGHFVCLSDNNFHENKSSDKFKMASDGCDWAMETFDQDNFVMCSECQNVFNSETGDNGETTVYYADNNRIHKISFFKKIISKIFSSDYVEDEDESSKKDVIVDGLELHKKALQLVGRGEKERYSILLKYIWEIERLDKDEKSLYSNDYKEALSEILEILEKEEDEENPRSTSMDNTMILAWDESTNEMGHLLEKENSIKKKHYNLVDATELLLKAEFYRRKKMFDRAIEVLNENSYAFFENYEKLADEMILHSKNKNSELFYIEVDNPNRNE
ncbi:MAG TPA: hypothetical protein P5099_02960 [Candidatus Moranbacteria bacterium]|nr:hypothetical protein [Candidatus Moranbacteria bacterium]